MRDIAGIGSAARIGSAPRFVVTGLVVTFPIVVNFLVPHMFWLFGVSTNLNKFDYYNWLSVDQHAPSRPN